MPPRNKRNRENTGLPERWRFKNGAYRYRVPPGLEHHWDGKKEFTLGSNLAEAHQTFSRRIGVYSSEVRTMKQLFERFLIEHVPTLEPPTQRSYQDSIKQLTAVFDNNPVSAVETIHCYQFRDKRVKAGGPSAAKHDLQVLSVCFSKAIEWGIIKTHPMLNVGFKMPSTGKSRRYVHDWEIIECLKIQSRRKRGSVLAIQAYIRVKMLTGLRRHDLLQIRMSDIKEDGIYVKPSKTANTTGKELIFEWSDELRKTIEMAKASRPLDIGPWLFCNRKGECYVKIDGTVNGWDSMWQRFMKRVLAETEVKESFKERDLRKKCGSDAESLERARELLAHADSRTTEAFYRIKPQRVKPLR